MTGNAINTKSEGLEQHELSCEKLDAVSGGASKEQRQTQREDKATADAMRTLRRALDSL